VPQAHLQQCAGSPLATTVLSQALWQGCAATALLQAS